MFPSTPALSSDRQAWAFVLSVLERLLPELNGNSCMGSVKRGQNTSFGLLNLVAEEIMR